MVVVLCHGTFDFLHWGHVQHFREASELGDWLIVTLTADAFVNKGPGRPIFNEQERAGMIRELRCVDEVHINHAPNAIPVIERFRPQIYCKSADYAVQDKMGFLALEIAAVEACGGRFVMTGHYGGFNSSKLIERLRRGL